MPGLDAQAGYPIDEYFAIDRALWKNASGVENRLLWVDPENAIGPEVPPR
jgi:hypothetical protein